jgi:predicted RNA binding protein YcfA (HicA-like mRNA interferase family)
MAELPSVDGRTAIRAFERAGFVLVRVAKSSHHILKRDGHPYLLSVPVHGGKPLKPGLLRGLIRDAGLTVEEFVELL